MAQLSSAQRALAFLKQTERGQARVLQAFPGPETVRKACCTVLGGVRILSVGTGVLETQTPYLLK